MRRDINKYNKVSNHKSQGFVIRKMQHIYIYMCVCVYGI